LPTGSLYDCEPQKRQLVAEQYQQHSRQVFERCLFMGGGNAAWAEDVTHDVFVRLLEWLPKLEPGSNLGAWLRTVAYNLCLERLRRDRSIWRRVRGALIADYQTDAAQTPEREVASRKQLAAVEACLQELPARQRAVIVMKFHDGMSQREIARALGVSEGQVSKLSAKATRTLRARGWAGV
jgi:RNA polymerase sigma-70 factor, ECF subfamily